MEKTFGHFGVMGRLEVSDFTLSRQLVDYRYIHHDSRCILLVVVGKKLPPLEKQFPESCRIGIKGIHELMGNCWDFNIKQSLI